MPGAFMGVILLSQGVGRSTEFGNGLRLVTNEVDFKEVEERAEIIIIGILGNSDRLIKKNIYRQAVGMHFRLLSEGNILA